MTFEDVIAQRLEEYEARAEQGLPVCGSGEPAQPHELRKGGGCVTACWACCEMLDGRLLEKRGWRVRDSPQFGPSEREVYCAECFRRHGWGGEFRVYRYGA